MKLKTDGAELESAKIKKTEERLTDAGRRRKKQIQRDLKQTEGEKDGG